MLQIVARFQSEICKDSVFEKYHVTKSSKLLPSIKFIGFVENDNYNNQMRQDSKEHNTKSFYYIL